MCGQLLHVISIVIISSTHGLLQISGAHEVWESDRAGHCCSGSVMCRLDQLQTAQLP